MSASFVQNLLRERLGELLAALDACAQGKGYFSMDDARAVAQSLDRTGTVQLTASQAMTLVRYLRGKGKWRGIGPNPVYVGKAKGRFKSQYRVLPAGHSVIARSASESDDRSSCQSPPARRRKRHIQVLEVFQAAHPDGGSMTDLMSSVMAAAPRATPLRIRRLAGLAIAHGLLVEKGRGRLVVAPHAIPAQKAQPNRTFTQSPIWIRVVLAMPDRVRDSDHGFTVQDLHAASWSFGDFSLGEARLALRELVKDQYLVRAGKPGRYMPEARLRELFDEADDQSRTRAPSQLLHFDGR